METLTFVQGIFSVIGFLMVGGIVWALRKIHELNTYNNDLNTEIRDLHLRIDAENQEINKLIEQMYRDMDSRFDKFEHRISKKQLLKG